MRTAAFPEAVMVSGIVVAALLAGLAVLSGDPRGRAWGMLGALVLTPVLLIAEIWESPQLQSLRDQPVVIAIAAGAGLALLGALISLFTRRPAWLAPAVAATLPFRVPIEAGGSTANLLVPLYLVLAAGALVWLVPRLRGRSGSGGDDPARGKSARALPWLLVGAVVLYAIQSAYSADVSKALEQVVFFYVPFALLFAVLRELDWTPAMAGRCLTVLVALALVFAAIGFVEYWQRELLLNPKVIASNQFESYFRVNSLFFDPNIYGRFLALVMLGLVAVLLWDAAPRRRWAIAIAVAVLWCGLLLTLSQSSFAALLLGLAVLAALRWHLRRTVYAAAAVLVLAAGFVALFPGTTGVELGDRESLDDATSGRYGLVAGGVELAADRPLYGWGAGSFSREYRRQKRASSERAASASHTIPVTVAAEQGVIGLAVYLALLACALAALLRGAGRGPARAAVAAAFCALVLHTWLYASFLEDPLAWALLAVGTALALRDP